MFFSNKKYFKIKFNTYFITTEFFYTERYLIIINPAGRFVYLLKFGKNILTTFWILFSLLLDTFFYSKSEEGKNYVTFLLRASCNHSIEFFIMNSDGKEN